MAGVKESFSVDVERPRAEVFEALTDLHRMALLSEGAVSVSPVPDRPRVGRGAAVMLKPAAGAPPGIGEVLCETLEWEPPSRCTRRFAVKDLPITASIRFEDIEGGTRVSVDLDVEPQSLMYKMMLPALALKLKNDKEKILAQIEQKLGKPPGHVA